MIQLQQYIRVADVCVTDPSHKAILDRFINASQAYVLTRGEEGVVFMLVSAGKTARFAMTNGVMLPGKTIDAILRSLLHHDGDTDKVFAEIRLPDNPLTLDTWRVTHPMAEGAQPCYRTYMSSSDLDKVLSFPIQKEYMPYRDVYVVTSTTSLKQGESLHRITLPVEMRYTVICPKGVKADPDVLLKGDRMTLTFTKPGYTSQSITLSAGSPSPFVKYEGAAILVNALEAVGINFTRRIPVVVRSSKGRAVAGYQITVNGRPVNTSRPYIDLTERDLTEGHTVEIIVTSTNFKALKVDLPAEKADVNTPLELVLQPEQQGITLRLNFSDGTTAEHDIALERNDPRYRSLRAGSYCGFRAHMISNPGEPERYNVEVRAGVKPVEIDHSTRPVEIRDKAAATEETEPATEPQNHTVAYDGEAEEAPRLRKKRRSYVPVWIICAAIVAAVVVAVYAVLYLPDLFNSFGSGDKESNVVDVTGVVSDTISDNIVQAEATLDGVAQPAAEPAAEAAPDPAAKQTETTPAAVAANPDSNYLNTTKVWKRADLTSDEGRRVYDLLGQGDIDAILADPYFRRANSSINPTAGKIADLLWQAKETPTQRSNEAALRKVKGEQSIDLWKLYEALARVRPAEPHEGQRP